MARKFYNFNQCDFRDFVEAPGSDQHDYGEDDDGDYRQGMTKGKGKGDRYEEWQRSTRPRSGARVPSTPGPTWPPPPGNSDVVRNPLRAASWILPTPKTPGMTMVIVPASHRLAALAPPDSIEPSITDSIEPSITDGSISGGAAPASSGSGGAAPASSAPA